MNELTVKGSDFGLEEAKAKEIKAMFQPVLDKMVELEKEFNDLNVRKITTEVCNEARTLRLQYRNVRISTGKIHKELKSFYLKGGRFVDGWKNAQSMASDGIEEKLSAIENHFKLIEEAKIIELQESREKELQKYNEIILPGLGQMDDQTWNNYLTGVKTNYQLKIDAEKLAEETKKKEARILDLHAERTKVILPYHQWWEPELSEPDFNFGKLGVTAFDNILRSLKQKKVDWDKEQSRILEENKRLEDEAKKRDEKEKQDRLKRENTERVEREKREKLESELNQRKEVELQKKVEEEKQIQAELSKGDKAKVQDLIKDLQNLQRKYQFKSVRNSGYNY
ncbi:hypothetical protein LCGC14_0500990 [marine sediment metagenome]|uniref:Uncharacterized protein n=1 Tax=marine sediment metagenome TaxID=412755 RepID=A0A0F9S8Y4_9ZZZZ